MIARRAHGVAATSAILAAALAAACVQNEPPTACTLEARAGLNVTVIDAATGAPVPDARVVAREGAFVETLQSLRAGEHFGVFERQGTYDLTVTAPGRQAWRSDGVVVAADECHVIPVRLTARLDPA